MEPEDIIEKPFPEIVYQYRDWKNPHHRDILKKCQVYMTSPLKFEDKNDCNFKEFIPITYTDFFLYHRNRSCFFHKDYSEIKLYAHAKYWALMHYKQKEKNMYVFDTYWKEIEIDKRNNHFGVLCLTDSFSNQQAWEKHGADSKGFCVAYNRLLLFDSIEGSNLWVNYVTELPTFDGRYDDFKTETKKKYYTKLNDYKWENEFRMTKLYSPYDDNPKREITIHPKCIKAVYLGAKMPDNYKQEIIELVRDKYGLEPIDLSKENL